MLRCKSNIAVPGDALHRRGGRNEETVVLVGAAHADALAFQQADDAEGNISDPHTLADRIQWVPSAANLLFHARLVPGSGTMVNALPLLTALLNN